MSQLRRRDGAAIVKAKLFLLAVLSVALFLSPLEQDSLRAQEAIDVRGRVVNGTEGAETFEGLNVLMLSLIHI